MDYVHFHCENCNSATPEMYDVKTILNITCIEELTKIINSNLVTHVRYDLNCKNCANIKNELINVNNYDIGNYHYDHHYNSLNIFNIKLIEEYGLFIICYNRYYSAKKINDSCTRKNSNDWTNISEKEFFDLIKVGSLLLMIESKSSITDKIKEKFYEANFIQIVNQFHCYLIESPTLTKPARK